MIFKLPWNITLGAIIIGFISMFLLLIAKPFGVTGELFASSNRILDLIGIAPINKGLNELGGCVANASSNSSYISNSFAATWGIIPGSFLASSLAGEFKVRIPKEKLRFFQSILRGIYGLWSRACNRMYFGVFLFSNSFYESKWVAFVFLWLRTFIGTKVIRRF